MMVVRERKRAEFERYNKLYSAVLHNNVPVTSKSPPPTVSTLFSATAALDASSIMPPDARARRAETLYCVHEIPFPTGVHSFFGDT